ncbi:hypothetical protein ABL78_2434 [Leptomonas seymouri]|uniref:Uncharacterized protein n=1 Tax=Leptomonas seymouri TaxID=5684 RepID=A0A0N1I988_LEPSE|nr:hypothetical protein ABL78_2434 [Leptomonas seymouri]|eukprot:KPI88472.1 hypothetical protein ABL78_2434 [Leptomonas seymouri]
MPLQAESLSNSYESSDSEGEWGGGQRRGRLTAAEELRAQLDDCLSLYGSRFVSPDISAQCIQRWKAGASAGPSGDRDQTSAGLLAQPPPASASVPPSQDDCGEVEAFDTSTVATVVVLLDGANATTRGPLRGVVVCFQYWAGFTVFAERHYASEVEARAEMVSLVKGASTIADMAHGKPGWTLLLEETAAKNISEGSRHETVYPDESTGAYRGDGSADEGANEEEGLAYESLMALLVHRYL